jgi:hypothetical protein
MRALALTTSFSAARIVEVGVDEFGGWLKTSWVTAP